MRNVKSGAMQQDAGFGLRGEGDSLNAKAAPEKRENNNKKTHLLLRKKKRRRRFSQLSPRAALWGLRTAPLPAGPRPPRRHVSGPGRARERRPSRGRRSAAPRPGLLAACAYAGQEVDCSKGRKESKPVFQPGF